ncbi:hypothetical protein NEAUS03_2360 [Nematocida ausubeli]|nr:hypothetical protein NEAUS03_2360 [Nematocida ausubeli]
MASTKKSSKESIKEYAIIAAAVLLILSMVLYTCVDTQPNQGKSQEDPSSAMREPGTSSTDRENSAVHENKEPGDGGSREVEEKVGTAIPVEQFDSTINTRDTNAPLDMNAPDEHSNSYAKEGKEVSAVADQTHYVVDMLRTVYGKERDTLEEMKSAACLAYKLVTENNEDLLNIKKKYDKYRDGSNLDRENISVLKEKIETYYRNSNDITRIPEGEDAEYDTKMKEIDGLYKKICDAEEDKKRALDEYIEAGMDGMKLEKNSNRSREDTLKHYSHAVEEENKMLSTIKCKLKLFKTIFDRDQVLYLVRGKEKWRYQKDENKTELLDEILKLHESYIEYLYNGINKLEDMPSIQKDVISAAEQVYSAYKAFDIAACKYKKEKELRKYISSGFQFRLETQV